MRRIPIRFPALLLASLLAAPLAAQVPGGLRPAPRAETSATVHLRPRHLNALQARLDAFAAELPAQERALWDGLLLRAASAGSAAGEVRVTRILEIGPGGGCEVGPGGGCEVGPGGGCEIGPGTGGGCEGVAGAANRVAIIVQGGRAAGAEGIVVQGGRTAGAEAIVVQGGRTATPATGIVVQGGRTPGQVNAGATPGAATVAARPGAAGEVRRPTEAVSIGPKQEDPTRPAPESLGRRLTEFSAQLPAEERGALEWLLTRAAAVPEARPATPGGLPPGAAVAAAPEGQPGPGGLTAGAVSLRQALGIDPVSIGPKQEDPTRGPPRPTTRWIIRY